MRVGQGFDAHQLVPGRPLRLGGVDVPHDRGLEGHSDGDALLHAVASALLGAAGEGDLGTHFPSSDASLAGIDSARILERVAALVRERGFEIGNVDATIIAQAPRLAGFTPQMVAAIAKILALPAERINVKVSSTDRLGAVGREEGIAALAIVLLQGEKRSVSDLFVYNTRTRAKERFEPIEPGHVRMYSCGPTVYSAQHIGNLRPYLFADLLRRTLEGEGLRVTHVINITDVGHLTDDADAGEDKMEMAAQRSGRRADEIAAEYEKQWKDDCARVGCLPPHVTPRATEHVPAQIAMAQTLEERGFTYLIADGLYFDVSKFPRYAELARLDLEGQQGGGRIGDVDGKRNPQDFALWKFAADGVKRQQEWDSPWGRGFPGWHLECSAMSIEYLGEHFDIHTGGVDHIPVHHSNEIAQSEAALGSHPWVNVWMHEEFLDFRGEKMSKSKGNVYVLDDLVAQGIEPLAYRYFFLQAHYRQQQTFTDEALAAAATGYDRLVGLACELREAEGDVTPAMLEEPRARFREALLDDLNAPRAMAVVWDVARGADLTKAERWTLLQEFDAVLGLDLAQARPRASQQDSDPRIDALVADRVAARERKDWAEADRLRDVLVAEGIVLEDSPEGTHWRRR